VVVDSDLKWKVVDPKDAAPVDLVVLKDAVPKDVDRVAMPRPDHAINTTAR
jgi:hypothetical protein